MVRRRVFFRHRDGPCAGRGTVFDTIQGWPIWQTMEESVYAWGALKYLPKALRDKKEAQLNLNIAETMESIGDSVTEEGYTVSQLKARQ